MAATKLQQPCRRSISSPPSFDRELTSPDLRERYRTMLADMVVSDLVSS